MLSSFTHLLQKLTIKLTLEHHLTQVLSDPIQCCLFIQTTEPRHSPNRIYMFIYQIMMCKSYIASAQMTPHWERRHICWRKEPPHRDTTTAWNSRPTRPVWGLIKVNVKSHAAMDGMSDCLGHSLGGPDGWQSEHVPAVHPCSSEGKPGRGLHQQEYSQIIEVCDYFSPFSTC